MESPSRTKSKKRLGVIARFLHLLSAQGAEGLLSTVFFLYLAWLNAEVYGEVMYALAAGGIVTKLVQFGLYYPLVSELGASDNARASELVVAVNAIKTVLACAAVFGVVIIAVRRGFQFQAAAILGFTALGFALEAIAETYFADLRVRGRQDIEGRIKIIAVVASYGQGIAAAALGMSPVVVGAFKLVSGVIRIILGARVHQRTYRVFTLAALKWPPAVFMFKAALVFGLIEILGTVYNKTNVFFLERATGVKGVAYYSATWNIVDPVSVLASEQLLGWVIFPLLAALWAKNREGVGPLVKNSAQWLMALAFPVMFVLYAEAPLIIGLVYPSEFAPAVDMQRMLVWTIVLSFENNLFAYVMMTAGAARLLLAFAACSTLINLALNVVLVERFGLMGGCLVIIFTKLIMTVLTYAYCSMKLKILRITDFVLPMGAAAAALPVFFGLESLIHVHVAVVGTLLAYGAAIAHFGPRFFGAFPGRKTAGNGGVS